MQPVTKKGLKELIEKYEAAGIDVSALKEKLANWDSHHAKKVTMGETSQIGDSITFSTGPVKK